MISAEAGDKERRRFCSVMGRHFNMVGRFQYNSTQQQSELKILAEKSVLLKKGRGCGFGLNICDDPNLPALQDCQ